MAFAITRFLIRNAALPARAARLLPQHRLSFSTATDASTTFETLVVSEPAPHVSIVTLNRPDKANAMNRRMWAEIGAVFHTLSSPAHPSRAIILAGAGKHFTSGLDIMDHATAFMNGAGADVGRKAWELRQMIRAYQASLTSLEACPKPVIAAVHSSCVGGGVDLICAADVRFASSDAWFCIKEAELGLTADVGTLQRMPKLCGSDSLVRELAFTARRMHADEALRHGFVSTVLVDQAELMRHALATAVRIASLSPVAVQGTKINLVHAREATTADGLEFAAAWNAAMLQSSDLTTAAQAGMTRGGPAPTFPDLVAKPSK